MNERIKKQMDFLLEIDKVKKISRQTYLSDASRKENDAEHSWHLAMMALVLSEYSNKEIDVLKTVSMVLIHDIIEIYSGDTYAYDPEANKTKKERELAAADRLFGLLPYDQRDQFRNIWDEFENKESKEALFAHTLDSFQPTMLNNASGGLSWEEHGIALSQVLNRNAHTHEGSDKLWNYSLYNFILPNRFNGTLYDDINDINLLRYELAFNRIDELIEDFDEIPSVYRDYFTEMRKVFMEYRKCIDYIESNNRSYLAPFTIWYKEIPYEDLKKLNERVCAFRYDQEYYNSSYADPDNSVGKFGESIGHMLCYLAAKICSLGPLCFEPDYYDITITAELFLEIFGIIKDEEDENHEGNIKSAIYYHEYDYMEDITAKRVMESLDYEKCSFADIVMNMDLSDVRSLYLYGEHISENEEKSFMYLNGLSDEKIDKIAYAFVNGYITSFKLAGIDLSKKKTVQIRYPVGFERIVRRAIVMFNDQGLKPVIIRSSVIGTGLSAIQTGCVDTNPQFAFDHRFDRAIYYNKAIKDRALSTLKTAYEKYSGAAGWYAGPAVIEHFGEKIFDPVCKPSACSYDETQRKLWSEHSINASTLINNYIKRENYSFTIIAFPLPDIGDDYEKIFDECIKLNTLDTVLFEKIQTTLIDTLNKNEKVHITGMNGNETDLYVSLAKLDDPGTQTKFENCLADVNIPVGEVFTSPVLSGTSGILNVKKVYINGLEYINLKIRFDNGMTKDYSCSNFDDELMNIKLIKDNLLKQHESLPMGEFAIGTNTVAYKMAREYDIAAKLPILIAEKTGPHIAIGDTCYSMSEDIRVYNPDGKEMIAKDNEVSALRSTDMNKAYFGCHTDITIPYDELGCLSAIDEEGNETEIIRDGLFVLEGTKDLNDIR